MAFPDTLNEVITQVRALLDEPTARFWSATEITNWIKEASVDISTKALCVEGSSSLTLVASQLEYDVPTDAHKIYSCVHVDAGSSNALTGLSKVHPRMLKHLAHSTAGNPKYYYHFAEKIGIFPLPTAAMVTDGDTVTCYYSKVTDDVTVLPDTYTPMAVLYAAYKARLKERKNGIASQLYSQYIAELNFARADLYERGVDSKDMFDIPDRTVIVQ